MNKRELTPKEEKFAQLVASGKTQADAYRGSYNAGSMLDATIASKASIVMAKGHVRARVDELRRPIVTKAQMTLETHLEDLLELRRLAVQDGKYSAAVSAEIARGKAAGLIVDKSEIDHHGSIEMNHTIEFVKPKNGEG